MYTCECSLKVRRESENRNALIMSSLLYNCWAKQFTDRFGSLSVSLNMKYSKSHLNEMQFTNAYKSTASFTICTILPMDKWRNRFGPLWGNECPTDEMQIAMRWLQADSSLWVGLNMKYSRYHKRDAIYQCLQITTALTICTMVPMVTMDKWTNRFDPLSVRCGGVRIL